MFHDLDNYVYFCNYYPEQYIEHIHQLMKFPQVPFVIFITVADANALISIYTTDQQLLSSKTSYN